MIHLDRTHLQVMMEAGYVYVGMRRFKEARAMFEGLSALAPDSEVPLVALGNVDFCENRLPQAIKRYRNALKIDPQSAFAKVYLGEAMIFSSEKAEGIKLLGEVAKADRGGAGDFARALLDAIKSGFDPAATRRTKKGGKA
ncbi:MAG: tetratricopeptide repeat protein [bacterium]